MCRDLVWSTKVNRDCGEYGVPYSIPFFPFVLLIPCGRCWWFFQGFSKATIIFAQHGSPSLTFFLGSRYQGDIPGKQEGGWPGEDIHHLQQGQGLASTTSSRCGPERKPRALLTGQLSSPSLGILLQGLLPVLGLRNLILVLSNVGSTGLQAQTITPTVWNTQWISWILIYNSQCLIADGNKKMWKMSLHLLIKVPDRMQ